ncbi:hypothetical protein SAY87_013320 [Trapa incisa]|uniref:Uncharacterized protein n=1 Tax=Trapa incisa TaxID=236973 RepID=A0AAN7KHZ6_9MYRT|nr:hypothetical protein SAY87_013320 [Trapa incisa]
MPKFQAATPSSAFIVFHRPLPPPPPPTTPSPPVPVLLLVLPLGLRICLYLILGLGTGLALGVLPMGDRDLLRLFLTVAVIFALRQSMQTLVWILAHGSFQSPTNGPRIVSPLDNGASAT